MEDEKHTTRWISGVEPPAELRSATGTQILEMECREQPQRLRDVIQAYGTDAEIRSTLRRLHDLAASSAPILFLGMGASFCSAISGAVMLQSRGKLAFCVDAGEWLHYGYPSAKDICLSILLTTSGESAELVELARNSGSRPYGLICNNPVSICWNLANDKLPILAGPEYGNATKTYTNATAISVILAAEILDHSWQEETNRVTDVYTGNLTSVFGQRRQLEAFCRGARNIEIIGRGAAYGAAIMSALCIREMSGQRATAHTGAGFKHGPILDVDASHVAVVFAFGRTATLGVRLAQECNRRGGKVVLVSNDELESTDKLYAVKLDEVPEPWEGITSVLVAQALTLGMVEQTGCRLPPRFQYGAMEQ